MVWVRDRSARDDPPEVEGLTEIHYGMVEARFREPIMAGDASAMFALGKELQRNGRTNAVAALWFRRSATRGHQPALDELPGLGIGLIEAAFWLRQAQDRAPGGPLTSPDYVEARRLEEAGDVAQAEQRYRAAAEAGNAHAAFRLARLLDQWDPDGGEEWLDRASRGLLMARLLLVADSHRDTPGDTELLLLSVLARAGNIDAAYGLAKQYENTSDYRDRRAKNLAREWYRHAARAGDASAAFHLGLAVYKATRKDDKESAKALYERWRRVAAELGHRAAAYGVGVELSREVGAEDEARGWIEHVARMGDGEAQELLPVLQQQWASDEARDLADHGAPLRRAAALLRRGDTTSAQQVWQDAASTGDIDAMFNLAVLSEHSSVPEATARWFKAAAEAGDPEATYRYGALLADRGERTEAERWLRRAAASNDDAACLRGVLRHQAGHTTEAQTLWRPRATRGHPESAFQLGLLHEEQYDTEQALDWYRVAADRGHRTADQRAGDLILSTDQLRSDRAWWELMARWARTSKPASPVAPSVLKPYRVVPVMGVRTDAARAPDVTRTDAAGPDRPSQSEVTSADTAVHELLEAWDELLALTPDPTQAVSFLSERSGMRRADVARVRRVRNRCAHPREEGWPSPYELDLALAAARELLRRLRSTD